MYKKGKPRLVSINMLKNSEETVVFGFNSLTVSVFDIDNEELYLD